MKDCEARDRFRSTDGQPERLPGKTRADAAAELQRRFGPDVVYEQANGNSATDRNLLRVFEQATKETAVWEPSARYWRRRQKGDPPGPFAR